MEVCMQLLPVSFCFNTILGSYYLVERARGMQNLRWCEILQLQNDCMIMLWCIAIHQENISNLLFESIDKYISVANEKNNPHHVIHTTFINLQCCQQNYAGAIF